MKQEEVAHLATLARMQLSEQELSELPAELAGIVEYVSVVSDIADNDSPEPQLTPRFNVFREDKVTNNADQHTDDLLREMPATDGRYMKVRKILKTE